MATSTTMSWILALQDLIYLPGSSLVACSFAAYLGVFSREYRNTACKTFVEFLHEREVTELQG